MSDKAPAIRKREFIVDYIKREAVGPRNGDDEKVKADPRYYYISGVLFPIQEEQSDPGLGCAEDAGGTGDVDETVANQVSTLAGRLSPSSIGLRALLGTGHTPVKIRVRYATYNPPGREIPPSTYWVRRPGEAVIEVSCTDPDRSRDIRLAGAPGYVRVILQSEGAVRQLTVYLVHDGKAKNNGGDITGCADPLYQTEIAFLSAAGSAFAPFGAHVPASAPMEDRIAALQHRHHKTFAGSYGSSCEWTLDPAGHCTEVRTSHVPRHEIAPLKFQIPGLERVLMVKTLAFDLETTPGEVIEALRSFVANYDRWISNLPGKNPDVASTEEAGAVVASCRQAKDRMMSGIDVLAGDARIREAFVLANRAMLMQAANSKGLVRPLRQGRLDKAYRDLPGDAFAWRPFQLAFLLLSIEPASQPDSCYRKCVDLIWFPTGGGKTEAYLGLIAFTVLLQRLRDPARAYGTSVISRYTMRLLTSQQFERTAALAAVLELMRNERHDLLGTSPISLGLWLGSAMTPNKIRGTEKYPGAEQLLERLLMADRPREDNPFKLGSCPACNKPLLPERRSEEISDYGYWIEGARLRACCLDPDCPMAEGIPVVVVDEQIYNELPTIVIGTIDKFARLAWIEEAGWLLNGKNGAVPPPSLIIQDELHLISGPLGSLAGVYETAVEALCATGGVSPHIIASTATVRRASEQVRALYGREVLQFPPPGLDEADSYFARKDERASGRLYLGILAPHVTGTTAAVRMHAILLQAWVAAGLAGYNEPEDAYSTLVSYFNSRKELGQATTLASDDIPDRLQVIAQTPKYRRRLSSRDFADLYSERKGPELSDIMKRLEQACDDDRWMSLLLTTNIISVGVSIDRLSLMLVNGQPKTTSEYIQATSRVGRSQDAPGLVITTYSATKPRDRSHYEQFVAYHSRLYASVEPTSVTPFSKPSRDRALHAILVVLARHTSRGLPGNDNAAGIRKRPDLVKQVRQIILERVRQCAIEEIADTEQDLEQRLEDWYALATSDLLRYSTRTAQLVSLLHREFVADAPKVGWPTMDSMRNVDFETGIMIVGAPRGE